MNRTLVSLLITFLLFPICLSASETGDSTPKHKVKIRSQSTPFGRPRIPSYQRIQAVYEDGILHIEFSHPEDNAVLTFTSPSEVADLSFEFDTFEPADFKTGILTFPSEFLITTDFGNVYVGTIEE